MKTLLLIALVILSACSSPPADTPSAGVVTTEENTPTTSTDSEVTSTESETETSEETTPTIVEGSGIPINKETSSFEFEGYGVGKSHIGKFTDWNGQVIYADGKVAGLKGAIKTASVTTGVEGLDTHLKSPDFFDAATHPEIVFESSEIEEGNIVGTLTIRGISRELTFPARVSENGVSAEFLIDISLFGIEYKGVDPEVRISFDFSS